MGNLKINIFLLPLLALILLSAFYLIILIRVFNKSAFRRLIIIELILAFLLNIVWELGQLPLFKGADYNIKHIFLCTLASLADAIMVLLIYLGLALAFKAPFWFHRRKWLLIVIAMIIGGTGGILAEIRNLNAGNWSYSDSMPIIPIVNVGLTPVLQFMLLPILIYYSSFFILRHIKNSNSAFNND
ncbi:MAG: hypothetical protein NVS1B13_18340 [Flavisolibacter sp.]